MTNNFKPKDNKKATFTPLSASEYAAKKKEEKDALYRMIDDTATEVVQSSEKFRAFLDTQSTLDRYSATNVLLIYKQKPKSSRLKDFKDWTDDGFKVSKGEKSISILEPVEYTKSDGSTAVSYNIKKVFDISQTNSKPRPVRPINNNPRELISVMIDTSPVSVEITDSLPVKDMGACYNDEKHTIFIKRNFGDSVALCQDLARELTYAYSAVNGDDYNRRNTDFSAACVGYMLCKKHGVDTRTFNLAIVTEKLSSKSPKEIRSKLSEIRRAYCDINSRITDELYRKRQDRSKDMER